MQSTRMRKSKAKSFKGIKHGILQMAGHLLYHHHTSKFKQGMPRPAFQPQLSTLRWSEPSALMFAN
jgi:hypothetical protein